MRLDRALTLGLFNPLRRLVPGPPAIPILMYHSISNDEENVHPYYHINTSPKVFDMHMKHLHDNGYSIIEIEEALNVLTSHNSKLSDDKLARYAVVTFDDGFHDFYLNAFPILQKYGFSGTVFLPTSFIGAKSLYFKAKKCLSWSEVRELHRYGINFGSHTVKHLQLITLPLNEIEYEIIVSKKTIEDQINTAISSFSYPYAFPEHDKTFIQTLCNTLKKSGYQNGVSTRLGTARRNANRFLLRRIPVNSRDDLRFFEAKLKGCYDWLRVPQNFYKRLKSV